ncbi:tRNA (mnm(5)s(2)U34)-methyltransferase [Mesobacillus maritimus]|uniref:16S rRNA (Cytosine(1402)-N(4))-methyltransferase n=1 Tax=Mesobacillus maritimus TaxID=1643336 RepID=A0ABS7K4K1_9BACI|nr:class I SAM-dependent methyltransferase [Mesobacillus maritimus]MBY0097181.1 16S rRNA (cytosine(1402)-N(4))-methyltransferase [Mesobacillus maritimus]
MKLERILPFARLLLEKAITPGDIAIDATIGNGHDTVFLAELVGTNGKVFGFDIQKQALESCREKLKARNIQDRVSLFHKGHQHVADCIPENLHGKVTGAVFNLGYLPGGDKSVVTTPETTISAVKQIFQLLSPEGIIVIVIYHGHPEGQIERDHLMEYVKTLDQKDAHVLNYQFLNQQNNPPFIIAIEKR